MPRVSPLQIVTIIGNPRPESRTHLLARTVAAELAQAAAKATVSEVDLAVLGPAVLDQSSPAAREAVDLVLASDLLVLSSPTYKATYSGLLKGFLDRFGNNSLAGKRAVPILLGGAPNHLLAVDVHFTPLLLELGASVPVRGLFVLEADVPAFGEFAAGWAAQHGPVLTGG
jgi:FMN reductase